MYVLAVSGLGEHVRQPLADHQLSPSHAARGFQDSYVRQSENNAGQAHGTQDRQNSADTSLSLMLGGRRKSSPCPLQPWSVLCAAATVPAANLLPHGKNKRFLALED